MRVTRDDSGTGMISGSRKLPLRGIGGTCGIHFSTSDSVADFLRAGESINHKHVALSMDYDVCDSSGYHPYLRVSTSMIHTRSKALWPSVRLETYSQWL